MSDQTKLEPKSDTQGGYPSRRQARIERRSARRADRQAGAWLGGVLLIALGALFMLQNTGYVASFSNWWALFILLPAFGSFSAGWGAYQRNGGEWTREAVGPMLAGLLFLGLTAVFLFDLHYSWLWPLFLIAAGLLVLAAPMLSRSR